MTTNRFRNRSPEIDAIQWTGSNADALRAFCGPDFEEIELDDRIEDPDQSAAVREADHGTWRGLAPGDWVVKLDGGLYEFSAADFAKQYEPAASPAAVSVPPPTTHADDDRRERYAVAIHDAMEPDLSLVDQEPGCQALFARAAEAAVALADAELAEPRRKLAASERIRENADFHLGQQMARRQLAEKEAARRSADRAAVLNDAAQRLYTALFPAVYDDLGQKAAEGVNRAVSELRRMADEAQQQPDTETRCERCGHSAGAHNVSGCTKCPGGWRADHRFAPAVPVQPAAADTREETGA